MNTCFETTSHYHTIAYYSHIIPVILALFLSVYALIKTRFSKLSIIFFLFTFSFSLWLAGDVVIWTTQNYHYVYSLWSWLDYVNIVFFALGAYFFGVLARGNISTIEKLIILLVCAPAFYLTITGNSVAELYQPWCEVLENSAITTYKLYAEAVLVLLLLFSLIVSWRRSDRNKRVQISVVALAILAFFAVFSVTEYIASITDIYEISLYGLFVLPVFLIAMVFAVTNLQIFDIRHLGTQLLVYVLLLMVGSQFLFLQSSTDAALNGITLFMAVLLGAVLLRNARRELDARIKIETLAGELKVANDRLTELDKQKSEFLSFASHQLRSPLTAIKGYASLILEGTFGPLSEQLKEAVDRVFQSTQGMVLMVEDFLNISRIEQGRMKYEMTDLDINKFAEELTAELQPVASKKGLSLKFIGSPEVIIISADPGKLRQVIANLIDNSIKYTPAGSVEVSVEKLRANIRVMVSDTGVGISKDEIAHLFEKFGRAKNANKVNVTGTGLGLYLAKMIVGAHKGKIWAESEGEGKGSKFIVELPAK
jgi:signal transduction histidine kinase